MNAIWLEAVKRSRSDKRVQLRSRHIAPEAVEIRTGCIERPRLDTQNKKSTVFTT